MKSALLCALAGLASFEASAKTLTREARQEPASSVEGEIGAGVGSFQDIQVPQTFSGARADGHNVAKEGELHAGIPIYAGLAWLRRAGAVSYRIGGQALRMASSSGPNDTQSSTYTRFDLGAAAAYNFTLFGLPAAVGGGAGVRRSVFGNVSNGHYFQGALLGAEAAIGTRELAFKLGAAASPRVAFGYYDGSMFSGHEFKKTTTSLSEASLSASYLIRDEVFFDAGYAREAADATIADVSEYDGFGLQVSPDAYGARAISVVTNVIRLGFHKEF